MIRPILTELTLFVAPFVLYALYLWATREGVLDMSAWTAPRLIWLSIAALVLVIISFVLLAQFGGAPPGSTYIPAHMENGRLVPGTER
jgi:quinol-cytochrome oxidoreductase complex cytochrome b subunit